MGIQAFVYRGDVYPPLLHQATAPPDTPRRVLTNCGHRLKAGYYFTERGARPAGFYDSESRFGGLRLYWIKTWQECTDPKPRVRLTPEILRFLR